MRAVIALAFALAAGAALAAPAPRLSAVTGAPEGVNWSGVWQSAPRAKGTEWLPEDAPLTPEYRARVDRLIKSQEAGEAEFEPAANCEPIGMPRFMSQVYGMEIWHRAGVVGIFGEYPGFLRHIHTDGRALPTGDDIDPTHYGTSVGHWEGRDLMVETVGIKGNVLLSREGVMISDQASVKERIHQVDANTLTDTLTLTDPRALTRPWTITKTYKRSPGTDMLEFFCDNNRHPTDANGKVTTVLQAR